MKKTWKPTYTQRILVPSILDRRLVMRAYRQQTIGSIVRALVTDEMAEEGYTAGNIEEGPVISASFNYESLRVCFDRLAEAANCIVLFDEEQKCLHFQPRMVKEQQG